MGLVFKGGVVSGEIGSAEARFRSFKKKWYRVKLDQLRVCSNHFLLSQWTHVTK